MNAPFGKGAAGRGIGAAKAKLEVVKRWFSARKVSAETPLKEAIESRGRHQALEEKTWRLVQVESSLACNLSCIMCPWKSYRARALHRGVMQQEVWEAIRPALGHARMVDFTGAGEPLLQPMLVQWMHDAKKAGCDVGLLTNGLLLTRERAHALIDVGIDWICFSVDSPHKDEYERIRVGSSFAAVCKNISFFTGEKPRGTKVMMNYVMMEVNFHSIHDFVRLAAELGADQINFRQCEHVRGEHGRGLGLFGKETTPDIRKREAALREACKLAAELGLETQTAPFTPFEQCVCGQDPRDSLFVRYDGAISPCNSLAYGGPSVFLGEDVQFPEVICGRLPKDDLFAVWSSDSSRFYRDTFVERCREYEKICVEAFVGDARLTPDGLLQTMRRRLPEPPPGCKVCHYLYGF
uniref:Radical SAM protein n=1 Tax=Desulfomonile tiedjei TaxID=2358 RepID=A0A7C4EWB9_9BACT